MAKRYTEEEIERGLTELALCGGDRKQAHERLKAAGIHIPAETIRWWAEHTWADRYQQMRSDRTAKIADRIANEAEDFALQLAEAERLTLAAYIDKLAELSVDQIASALRNITTSKSLNVDRIASPLRGRPTQIVEHRDISELAKKLERVKVIEGTAEEIEDQAVLTDSAG